MFKYKGLKPNQEQRDNFLKKHILSEFTNNVKVIEVTRKKVVCFSFVNVNLQWNISDLMCMCLLGQQ